MSPFSGLSLGAVKDPAPLLNMEHRDIVIVIVAVDKSRVQTLLIMVQHCSLWHKTMMLFTGGVLLSVRW